VDNVPTIATSHFTPTHTGTLLPPTCLYQRNLAINRHARALKRGHLAALFTCCTSALRLFPQLFRRTRARVLHTTCAAPSAFSSSFAAWDKHHTCLRCFPLPLLTSPPSTRSLPPRAWGGWARFGGIPGGRPATSGGGQRGRDGLNRRTPATALVRWGGCGGELCASTKRRTRSFHAPFHAMVSNHADERALFTGTHATTPRQLAYGRRFSCRCRRTLSARLHYDWRGVSYHMPRTPPRICATSANYC